MNRKSGFYLMKRLILELKPLIPVMFITISMGVLGFLASISITSFGAVAIVSLISEGLKITFTTSLIIMTICAILRGPLRYAEQLSGHYIAFKILVILRDKVFTALRKLAPSKLENKEKGNLVSLITSDIELLEVFYAHTIAPISIAIITNTIIAIVLYSINPYYGLAAAILYLTIGLFIPYFTSKIGKKSGLEYRNKFGETNSYLLDSLRGLREVLVFKNGDKRRENIHKYSEELNEKQKKIKLHEGIIRATTDFTIMIGMMGFVVLGIYLYLDGTIEFGSMIIAIVILASSFGPVVALSNLSNNLLQTFASAERIFNLLDEKPEVVENEGEKQLENTDITYENVTFGYKGREDVLKNIDMKIKKGDSISIVGESGSGKSTFVKLLMRFWDVKSGQIEFGGENVKTLETNALRNHQVLMSQETYLFNETIEDNIKISNLKATEVQVKEAAKKAAIHDFIESLPKGYKTKVGELGSNLSSGEKQRIGLARAFLSKGEVLILDEPTSNLDTLNEGVILNSIKENKKDKTIILITHRKSTSSVCEKVFRVQNKKLIRE
ncbi:ABC transporter ATP-binding protein/permease [Clostridium sardiniense]|uniref:ABC transporter ATP-binding protein/permease n=1 Tax=Clostridium sardiniense TaxID=29369 RepID=A0ABS7KTS5_CLOSR|nr:ABC transporter ATP-binding protein [Clostridium sardiniense]MBY0754211.1 ABC transporter ATP-binding protein/permease [Clostridium sardiniense]MDQ0461188.1 ATP-binding cassette subfamily C protein [Clostridium sardiniense]